MFASSKFSQTLNGLPSFDRRNFPFNVANLGTSGSYLAQAFTDRFRVNPLINSHLNPIAHQRISNVHRPKSAKGVKS
jgi:hypothetical protein